MYSIQADSDLGDNQSVWKRVFQGIMDRADTYRFTGFVNLHDAVEAVHVETYYDLCEKHNSLNLERDELVEAFDSKNKNRDTSTDDDSVAVGTENLNSELAVLVARASNHNARAKVFSFNVLKALEDLDIHKRTLRCPDLSSYRFPEPAASEIDEAMLVDEGIPTPPSGSADSTDTVALTDVDVVMGLDTSIPTQAPSSNHLKRKSRETDLDEQEVERIVNLRLDPDEPGVETAAYSALGLYNVSRISRLRRRTSLHITNESEHLPDLAFPVDGPVIDPVFPVRGTAGDGLCDEDQMLIHLPSPNVEGFEEIVGYLPPSVDRSLLKEIFLSIPKNTDSTAQSDAIAHTIASLYPSLDSKRIVSDVLAYRSRQSPTISPPCADTQMLQLGPPSSLLGKLNSKLPTPSTRTNDKLGKEL